MPGSQYYFKKQLIWIIRYTFRKMLLLLVYNESLYMYNYNNMHHDYHKYIYTMHIINKSLRTTSASALTASTDTCC